MRSLFVTAAALTLLCGAAWAQTSTSGSDSNANVGTTSGSQSNSVSNPRVNVYGNPIGNGASSTNSSASGRSNSNSRSGAAASSGRSNSTSEVIINNNTSSRSTGGSAGTSAATDAAASTAASGNFTGSNYTSTQTLRNTPEIAAPSIIGGDPCTVGGTGGVSLPGFGIVAARSWEGKACERRQVAALLYNMGHDSSGARGDAIRAAAVEVMCVERGVREALKRIGQPCVADRDASRPPSPVVSEAPSIAVAIATPPPAAAANQRPDWCSTASAQEQRAHKVCGG
jgi:hypothetical protein